MAMGISIMLSFDVTAADRSDQYYVNDTGIHLIRSDGTRSPHFTVNHVRCHFWGDSSGCSTQVFSFDPRLVDVLDSVREHFGRDVEINRWPGSPLWDGSSLARGFRCVSHARAWDRPGHRTWFGYNESHVSGRGVDISVNGVSADELYRFVVRLPYVRRGSAGDHINRHGNGTTYALLGATWIHIEVNSGPVVESFRFPGIFHTTAESTPLRHVFYGNETIIANAPVGTELTILEARYNTHGNEWFLLDDIWVYSGNFMRLPANIARRLGHTHIARGIEAGVPIRHTLYADGDILGHVPMGTFVQVAEERLNTRGNLWLRLELWVYSGNLSATKPVPTSTIENGIFAISSVAIPSHRLNVRSYNPPARGNNVTIAPSYTSRLGPRYVSSSTWRLEQDGDAWIIWSTTPNINLNAFRNVTAIHGTNVNVWSWVAENTQRWIIQDRGNGQFSIASQSNPHVVVSVTGAEDRIEQHNVTMAYFSGCTTQLWTFVRQW